MWLSFFCPSRSTNIANASTQIDSPQSPTSSTASDDKTTRVARGWCCCTNRPNRSNTLQLRATDMSKERDPSPGVPSKPSVVTPEVTGTSHSDANDIPLSPINTALSGALSPLTINTGDGISKSPVHSPNSGGATSPSNTGNPLSSATTPPADLPVTHTQGLRPPSHDHATEPVRSSTIDAPFSPPVSAPVDLPVIHTTDSPSSPAHNPETEPVRSSTIDAPSSQDVPAPLDMAIPAYKRVSTTDDSSSATKTSETKTPLKQSNIIYTTIQKVWNVAVYIFCCILCCEFKASDKYVEEDLLLLEKNIQDHLKSRNSDTSPSSQKRLLKAIKDTSLEKLERIVSRLDYMWLTEARKDELNVIELRIRRFF